MESMLSTVSHEGRCGYCTACFSGDYPIPPEPYVRKEEHEA